MGAGVLFALTLPGLVILLIALATVEHAWSRVGRRSPLLRRHRHALSAGGLDVFSAALVPGRTADLEERGRLPGRRTGHQGSGKCNLRDTSATQRLPTVGTMTTSTEERTSWVCDNCHGTTATVRKRCSECGTSRH